VPVTVNVANELNALFNALAIVVADRPEIVIADVAVEPHDIVNDPPAGEPANVTI
jgi:hypothetical protein